MYYRLKKLVLLNFPTEIDHNWGCLASNKGLEQIIRKRYRGYHYKFHPIHFRLPGITIPHKKEAFNDFIENLDLMKWEEYPDFKKADVVILNGEGSLHEFSDSEINDNVYLKMLNIYAAKVKYGKKTMIINHTLDFISPAFEFFVKTVYPTCDYISVRESRSKKLLDSMGIPSQLTADTAFIYSAKISMQFEKIRSALAGDKYYVFFIAQLIDVDSSYFISLCSAIWNKFRLKAVFFILSEREKSIIEPIRYSSIPHLIVDYFLEPIDIIEVLKEAVFCLSGRFHATIFSALANTPFIGFRSNTFKLEGLIEQLNYPFPVMFFGKTNPDEILCVLDKLILENNKIKTTLKDNVRSAQQLAWTTNVIKL